jgi:hypothetical protein
VQTDACRDRNESQSDRSKEKTIEVPRRAAKVFKKRQDQLDARKAWDGSTVKRAQS